MTINLADNSPRISYAVAQGATQTSFAVPFEFFADADLNVYVDGTLKTLTTHYTVSGGDGSTGTVTISVTGATGGSTVVITRDVALERTSDFPSSGPFQIGALNTELDRLTAIAADLDDKAGRALQLTDFDVAASLVLPTVDNRKGKTLAFNASSGAVEAGPTISDVQTVSAAAADIQTLAHIEDGTDATNAIQTVAGIASNVSTVAGVSSAVSTVAGISSNVTAVAADATDIGVVAGKAAEIGRLGTAQAVADLDILATTDAVSDMNTLAAISANISTVAGISANVTSVAGVASLITSDFVADLNTLATSDIVSDLNTLATADIVSDLNTLATSDIVSDLNTLATADIVSDLNTLATTDIVSDLNTLATTDIVTDLNLLATSAIVEDLNLLATSTVIADMATLAGAGANPNISSLGVSGNITFADNGKAIFGAGSDLQIYHDGSHSYISDEGTGSLRLRGVDIQMQNTAGVNAAKFISGADVQLFYAGSQKLATTSTGIDVTGGVTTNAYSYLNGLRISGADTGNTVYQQSGDLSISSASGTISLKPSGTNILHATNTGVGIGTSSPAYKLDVITTNSAFRIFSTNTAQLNIQAGDANESKIEFGDASDNDRGVISYDNPNNAFKFNTNASERMRIDSSGRVGIGDVPKASFTGHSILQVGGQAILGANDTLSSTGQTYLSHNLYYDTSGTPQVFNTSTANEGTVYAQVDGVHKWSNSAATTGTPSVQERMRLDASGNLLVGKTSADVTTAGARIFPTGDAAFVTNGSAPIIANRLTSDGDIALFRKDGTAVGSIGVNSQRPYIGSSLASTDANIKFTDVQILPCDATGTNTDGADDIGASGSRFKDLYLSGGVYLGGTGAANKLDDYEEGTWTPSVQAGSISGTSITYTGYYRKVGSLVYIHFRASNSAGDINVSSYVTFSGLPFTLQTTSSGAVVTEDVDVFDRQGFAAMGGTTLTLSNCGSSSGTTDLYASLVGHTA